MRKSSGIISPSPPALILKGEGKGGSTPEEQGSPAAVSLNNGSAFIIKRGGCSTSALFEVCLWKIDCHEHYVAE